MRASILVGMCLVLACFLIALCFMSPKPFETGSRFLKLALTANPLGGPDIVWGVTDCDFMKYNWPNTMGFEVEIKKDILQKLLSIPRSGCVVDCGAHVGDGAIPLAAALTHFGRSDIVVYACDPSPFKCEYISLIKTLNNLKNIKIMQLGLSDKRGYYTYTPGTSGTNTGGTIWTPHQYKGENICPTTLDKWVPPATDSSAINPETILFETLDMLVLSGKIPETILVLHLDVESMEPEALRGGMRVIERDRPHLSIEDLDTVTPAEQSKVFQALPSGYRFVQRILSNNCFQAEP
jgi:FkbM family methyltransferase